MAGGGGAGAWRRRSARGGGRERPRDLRSRIGWQSAHVRRGRQRAMMTTVCSRLGARLQPSLVKNAREIEQRRGDSRRQRHRSVTTSVDTKRRPRTVALCPTTRSALARRGRQRVITTTACSRLGARSQPSLCQERSGDRAETRRWRGGGRWRCRGVVTSVGTRRRPNKGTAWSAALGNNDGVLAARRAIAAVALSGTLGR